MQTHVMDACDASLPWFECDAESALDRTAVRSLPFTIGRVESADLQINSTRVSREHAMVVRDGSRFRARDLGSTNGTLLNGEPITDAIIAHGDVLTIGDTELTFFTSEGVEADRMATQVMTGRSRSRPSGDAIEVIQNIRRMQEVLLHQAFKVQIHEIACLGDNHTYGFRSTLEERCYELPSAGMYGVPLTTVCRLTERFRQLYRLAAVQRFNALHRGETMFVPIDPSELAREDEFTGHITRLVNFVTANAKLVLELPAELVCQLPQGVQLRSKLAALGAELAYGNFVGNGAELEVPGRELPHWILVSPSLVQDVQRQRRRRRQLEALLETCAELDCRLILERVHSEGDRQTCHDLGIEFVQQAWEAQPGTSPLAAELAAMS